MPAMLYGQFAWRSCYRQREEDDRTIDELENRFRRFEIVSDRLGGFNSSSGNTSNNSNRNNRANDRFTHLPTDLIQEIELGRIIAPGNRPDTGRNTSVACRSQIRLAAHKQATRR